MFPKDPLIKRYRRLMIISFMLFSAALVLDLISYVFNNHRTHGGIFQFGSPASVIFWLVIEMVYIGLLYTVILVILNRRERKRQLATQGDPKLLAEIQPVPDATTLALPVKIEVGADITKLVCFVVVPVLVICLVVMSIFLALRHSVASIIHSPLILLFIGIFLVILVVYLVIIFVVLVVRLRQSIEVSDEGITTKFLGKVTMLRWEEMRFFALAGVNKRGRQDIYELSNPEKVMHWTRLHPVMPFYATILKPKMPYDEYESKMQALSSLIVARTHLPLYDLRNQHPKWYM